MRCRRSDLSAPPSSQSVAVALLHALQVLHALPFQAFSEGRFPRGIMKTSPKPVVLRSPSCPAYLHALPVQAFDKPTCKRTTNRHAYFGPAPPGASSAVGP